MSALFLILKRGLYYRPGSEGYTGVKEEAGRYTLADVAEEFPNRDSDAQDGITFVSEADAPDYSNACCWDVRLRHQTAKAEARASADTAWIEALEAENRQIRAGLTALASTSMEAVKDLEAALADARAQAASAWEAGRDAAAAYVDHLSAGHADEIRAMQRPEATDPDEQTE